MKKVLIFFALLFFVSCANKYEALPTAQNINLQKYLGTWYEIARFPHFFEKNCKNVKAQYKLNDDGDIQVKNFCKKIDTNKTSFAKGLAYNTNETNTKLKVSFFRPFWGDYWILMLGQNYEYAVVGTPSREYLWILSRTKTISDELKSQILKKVSNLKFDTKKLIWTIQE